MTNTTPTDPALILARIIRQVDGKHALGADALAAAILPHLRPPNQDLLLISAAEHIARQGEQSPSDETSTATATPWPEISDSLIRRLIGDITAIAAETAEAACIDRHVNPIREARARLLEILQLAAEEALPMDKPQS